MGRNMDIIRAIVLAARESSSHVNHVEDISKEDYLFHAALLEEAGLVRAAIQETQGKVRSAIIFRLTWAGQDFADSILDDTVWNKAKDAVIKPAISFSFGILVEYLKQEALRKLGID